MYLISLEKGESVRTFTPFQIPKLEPNQMLGNALEDACDHCHHPLRTKALAVLDGTNEGLDHLRLHKIPVELIEFVQPETVTIEVVVG